VLVAAKLLFWKDIEAFGWWLGCKAVVGVSDFEVFQDCKAVKLQGCCLGLPGCTLVLQSCTVAWLQGCEAAGLLPGAARLHIGAAKLHSCMAARLQGCRLHGCKAAWLQGCMAARLQGCTAARLSELVWLQIAALLVQLSCNS
jgi:hypothetical protein